VRYFVITIDGAKFGPADPATLAEWTRQGRVTAESVLESETGFQRTTVQQVLNGASIPVPAPEALPDTQTIDNRRDQNLWVAGIAGVIGTIAFFASFYLISTILAIGLTSVSIHFAKRACAAEKPGGQTILILSSAVLLLSLGALCAHFVYGF